MRAYEPFHDIAIKNTSEQDNASACQPLSTLLETKPQLINVILYYDILVLFYRYHETDRLPANLICFTCSNYIINYVIMYYMYYYILQV